MQAPPRRVEVPDRGDAVRGFKEILVYLTDLGLRLDDARTSADDLGCAAAIVDAVRCHWDAELEKMWQQRRVDLVTALATVYRRYRDGTVIRHGFSLKEAVFTLFKSHGVLITPEDLKRHSDLDAVRERGGPVDAAAKALSDLGIASPRSTYNWRKLGPAPRLSHQGVRVLELRRLRYVLGLLRDQAELASRTVHDDLLDMVDAELARRNRLLAEEAD
jgi:hypothetical protein